MGILATRHDSQRRIGNITRICSAPARNSCYEPRPLQSRCTVSELPEESTSRSEESPAAAESPAEPSAEVTAESPAEPSAEVTAESPAEPSAELTATSPAEAPAKAAAKAPAPAKAAAPTESPAKSPAGPTFESLGLPDALLQSVQAQGYTIATPIQVGTIPALLEGRDVLGQAQTGTGKTAAFALPILARLNPEPGPPQALVLAPTRELAVQVAEAFETYGSKMRNAGVATIYGGQPYPNQFRALSRRPPIVVGTPGRVIDHLERGSLDISALRWLVLDEADEMLRMGFVDAVTKIIEMTPETRSMVLFSATLPNAIRRIAKARMTDPVEVRIAPSEVTAETVRQRYLAVHYREKFEALSRLLEVEDNDGTLIFVRTKAAAAELAQNLTSAGIPSAPLSGDLSQPLREATVNRLKSGHIDIIVATDVAARGLDVERITHVINYDIPFDSEAYVHRIGRTGRAGRSGDAILFVQPKERRMLAIIERSTKQRIERMDMPTPASVNKVRVARFKARLTSACESSAAPEYAALIGEWCAETGRTAEEAAAALAQMAQSGPLLLRESGDQRGDPRADRGKKKANRPVRESEHYDRDSGRDDRDSRRDDRDSRRDDRDYDGPPSRSFGGGNVPPPRRVERERPEPRNFEGARREEHRGHDRSDGGDDRRPDHRDDGPRPPEGGAERGDWRSRSDGAPPRNPRYGMVWYRVAVGAKQSVTPKHLVGAIANEAGLSSQNIGIVDIHSGHSWVELPVGMPKETLNHLKRVWVQNTQIRLERF
jgi:ATP-dependent RNA helicase DeaD